MHKDASHAGLKGEHADSRGRPTAHSPPGPPEPCASTARRGLPPRPRTPVPPSQTLHRVWPPVVHAHRPDGGLTCARAFLHVC